MWHYRETIWFLWGWGRCHWHLGVGGRGHGCYYTSSIARGRPRHRELLILTYSPCWSWETLILSSEDIKTRTQPRFSQEDIRDQTVQHFPDRNEGPYIKELNSRFLCREIQGTWDETHKPVPCNKHSPNNSYHQRSLGNQSGCSSTPGECPRMLRSEKPGDNPDVHQQRKAHVRCGLLVQWNITIFHWLSRRHGV